MTSVPGTASGLGRGPRSPTARPPLLSWRVDQADAWRAGTVAAVVGLAIGIMLAVFGLPPVDLHTPLHHAGIMDPLCGGTRALRLAALGQWGQSWMYNPLGIPVLLGFAALVARAIAGGATGRWYAVGIGWTTTRIWTATTGAVVLLIALEVRQQSIAELLMAR